MSGTQTLGRQESVRLRRGASVRRGGARKTKEPVREGKADKKGCAAELKEKDSSRASVKNEPPEGEGATSVDREAERILRRAIEENAGCVDAEGAPEEAIDRKETAREIEAHGEAPVPPSFHDRSLDSNTWSSSSVTVSSDITGNVLLESETAIGTSTPSISIPQGVPPHTLIVPWPCVVRPQDSSVPFNMAALSHVAFASNPHPPAFHISTHRRHWYFKHLSSLFILALSIATLCFMLFAKNINIGSSFEAAAFVLVAGATVTKVISSCVWERPAPAEAVGEGSLGRGVEMQSVQGLASVVGSGSTVSLV
jgi:hypothetical protein